MLEARDTLERDGRDRELDINEAEKFVAKHAESKKGTHCCGVIAMGPPSYAAFYIIDLFLLADFGYRIFNVYNWYD